MKSRRLLRPFVRRTPCCPDSLQPRHRMPVPAYTTRRNSSPSSSHSFLGALTLYCGPTAQGPKCVATCTHSRSSVPTAHEHNKRDFLTNGGVGTSEGAGGLNPCLG